MHFIFYKTSNVSLRFFCSPGVEWRMTGYSLLILVYFLVPILSSFNFLNSNVSPKFTVFRKQTTLLWNWFCSAKWHLFWIGTNFYTCWAAKSRISNEWQNYELNTVVFNQYLPNVSFKSNKGLRLFFSEIQRKILIGLNQEYNLIKPRITLLA